MNKKTKKIKVALAGNPNSGKTSLFNAITGARQHVGNYPGVTVEKKTGSRRFGDYELEIIDLPGIYSLTAHSVEEIAARNFLVEEKPDVVVDIIDSSNLERNLYLAVQLMEMGVPLVLAFNMSDVSKARGFRFDIETLSGLLRVPIVQTVGNKNQGIDSLLDVVLSIAGQGNSHHKMSISYGEEIDEEIEKLQKLLESKNGDFSRQDRYWLGIKLLEGDAEVKKRIGFQNLNEETERSSSHLEKVCGDHPEMLIAERRYGFISGVVKEGVASTIEQRKTMSDKIDSIVTNRLLGLPFFLGLMYLVFHLTFTVGDPMMRWIESFFGCLGGVVEALWPAGSESALNSLLMDGIIGGVGGVIVFLPNILLLFLAIAILEDSGYMARAAFIMDRLMHKIGLHGKSFIPMLIGFGCSVPAIMATRTLENRRDRLTTMLVVPLMSCSARLPIYALIIPAFFPQAWHGSMLWIIYMIGIVLAIVSAKLLRSTVFKGASTPFVMELPPYRMPTLRGVIIHMWERGWLYLKKAGTVILGISIVLWALVTYPQKEQYDQDYDTISSQATAEYLTAVEDLNGDLGLPEDFSILRLAFQAELDMLAKQKNYHNFEPGFEDAEAVREAIIERLKEQEGGSVLAEFMTVLEQVTGARNEFESAVEEGEFEESMPEYELLKDRLSRTLTGIESTYATAAIYYLDNIRAPFKEKIVESEQARQAEDLAYSIAGRIGHWLEPLVRPMGFDWKIATAMIGAFAAKEVFVAQMGIVYSVGEVDKESDALRNKLAGNYSPLVAFCIMLFALISAPCMATIAITKRESNSWKWALFQLGGLTALAWMVTVFTFQLGALFGIGL